MMHPDANQFKISQEQFETQYEHLKSLQGTYPRGGAKETIGYDDTDVIARHLHVVISDTYFLTPVAPSLWDMVNDQIEYAAQEWEAVFPGLPFGEICLRWISYPAQTPNNLGHHTDFCALTVPLYSSQRPVQGTFFGQMIEEFNIPEFKRLGATRHCFSPAENTSSLYAVAFCQLSQDTISSDGQRYGDVLTSMCSRQDRTNRRKY